MATGPRYSLKYRRRREGKTDYKARLAILKGRTTRMVVRRSSRYMNIQFIDYTPEGDKVVGTASSKELKALGWTLSTGSTPAAYLTGLLASKKVGGRVKRAVLDIGQHRPKKGARVFAALKGAIDGGIEIPHSEDVLPSEDRLKGAHIEAHMKTPAPSEFEKVKAAIGGLKDGKVPTKEKKVVPRPTPKPGSKPGPKPAARPDKKADDLDELLKDLTKEEKEEKPKSSLEDLLKKRKKEG